jgi:hypothetical protein
VHRLAQIRAESRTDGVSRNLENGDICNQKSDGTLTVVHDKDIVAMVALLSTFLSNIGN